MLCKKGKGVLTLLLKKHIIDNNINLIIVMENISENRAGRYRKTLSGEFAYESFIPNDLPPTPPVMMDDKMQTLLSEADRALGGLNVVADLLPDSNYFILSYLRKEATLSSKIEGTKATFVDVAKAQVGVVDEETPNDYREIINYIDAINYGLRRIRKEEFPFSLRLLREIHAKLLSGVRGQHKTPGEFRKSQNWIGGASIRTAHYIPPAAEEIWKSLDNFEKFIHDTRPMPALIKIGIIHSQFETIHPFLDGNGRMGRLLITLLLCHYKILNKPTLYLSEYFSIFRSDYYDRLNAVHEKGDFEGWLKFFLEGVALVAVEATQTARKINSLKEEGIKKISCLSSQSSKRAISLIEKLFSQPVMTVNDVAKGIGITFANANNLVRKMEEMGILKQIGKSKRNRLFAYTKYLVLFKERDSYKKA
ncbi:MAG: hypothetical protein UW11_C0014G0004 [Parcubacteria group bacterium GW2011_GWA2_43_9b]|nr:MAG: hypothetical protein UW11_C0014G0004 [Parcubacteria group bacterium GW2011_GWA2_43_9b]